MEHNFYFGLVIGLLWFICVLVWVLFFGKKFMLDCYWFKKGFQLGLVLWIHFLYMIASSVYFLSLQVTLGNFPYICINKIKQNLKLKPTIVQDKQIKL